LSTGVALTQAVIAVLTVVASLFGFILQRRVARSRTAEPKIATLEDRLEELGCTMRSAARLLNQVEAEIQARSASAERLKEEAQAAENLVKLNQAQRDAIAKLVRNEIGAETKKATRQSYIASALFFIAGVAATITITLLIHPLH
jgi:CHASE1-domain containing sensor protein